MKVAYAQIHLGGGLMVNPNNIKILTSTERGCIVEKFSGKKISTELDMWALNSAIQIAKHHNVKIMKNLPPMN